MKTVYCSNCGTCLEVTRRALKSHARIINMIPPHECPEEPLDIDSLPIDVPAFMKKEEKGKFEEKLDGLSPPPGMVGTGELRDRRAEEVVKSSAPPSVLDQMSSFNNTSPANDISEEPEDA